MVKVINIDTKTRTIHISNADGDIKTWRTTESGAHFPIRKGESTKEALDKFVGSKRPEAKKDSGLLGDRYDAKHGTKTEKSSAPLLGDRSVKDVTQPADKKQQPAEKSETAGWPESPKFEKLTEQYMPKQGEADNQLGEMLRSINRVVYRYYNDGDMWNKGYGKETVNQAIKHLTELAKNKETPRRIARGLDNALYELKKYGTKDKDRYETALKIMMQTVEWADQSEIDALSKMKAGKKEPERNWQRGRDEDEDAYFARREKTLAEARKLDKVSDWYGKAYKGDSFGKPKNKDLTFDELADGLLSGKIDDFYEAVGTGESDVREKIFQELSERTGRPYDDFYDAWLYGGSKGTESRKKKQAEAAAWMDKLLELHTDMDPDLRKAIVAARDRAKKDS